MTKKEAKQEEREAPQRERRMGVHTGYHTDGTSYWLAPTHVDSFGEPQDEQRSLDNIIAAMTSAVAQMHRKVEKQRRGWWDRVYQDLGLDPSIVYVFNRIEGKISPRSKDEGEKT